VAGEKDKLVKFCSRKVQVSVRWRGQRSISGRIFLSYLRHRSRIRYLSKKIANFNEFSEIKKL